MRRLDVMIPSSWRQVSPPNPEYDVNGVTITLGPIQGVVENAVDWLRFELRRVADGADVSGATINQRVFMTGWPAVVVETQAGDRVILLVMYLFLEHTATVVVDGPTAAVTAERDGIIQVLEHITIDWGVPPPSLAAMFDGVAR